MTPEKKKALNKGIKTAKSYTKDNLKSLVKENGAGLTEKKKPTKMTLEKKTAINKEGKAVKSIAKDTLESPAKKNDKKRKLASDDAPKEKKRKKVSKEEIKLNASIDESVHSIENDVPKLTVKKTKLPQMDEIQKKKKLKSVKKLEKKQKDSEGELVFTNETKPVRKMPVPVISDTFESLRSHVSEATMRGIESFGFKKLTEVQKKTIPLLLAGKDVRAVSKTGSGKTLAFLIPAIERIKDCQGLSCIVLSPTRELALQLHGVVKTLAEQHGLTHGIVMGGVMISKEQHILEKGVNILVSTPGRLLDHLKQTRGFKVQKLRVLVVDEADRILDDGFEKQLEQILRRLPKTHRQSMLFSATVTPKLSAMTLRALGSDYDEVNLVGPVQGASASDNLTQSFLLCPTFQRLIVLYKILKDCANKKKIMVFFSTCDSVNFYKKLFNMLKIKVECIHGRQGQKFRTENYNSFVSSVTGTLLCTDVAARGWDIPAVDLIVQYDPPIDVKEYIHRVGRAARREGEKGKAVLFLRDEELPLLQVLKDQGAVLSKYEDIDMYDLDYDVQQTVNELVSSDAALGKMGTRAYRNFLTSYTVLQPSHVYDRKTIPTKELAKNFGLVEVPEFDFNRVPLHFEARDLLRYPKAKNAVVWSTKGISKAGGSSMGGKSVFLKNIEKNRKELAILINGAQTEKQNERKKKMKERKKLIKMRNRETKPDNGVAPNAGGSKNKKRPLSGEVMKATEVSIKKIKHKSSSTDVRNTSSTIQIKKALTA